MIFAFGRQIFRGGQYRTTFVPNYSRPYRITFSVPVPALHLVLSTGTDLELLLVLLNRYFLLVLLFCFTFKKLIILGNTKILESV